MLTTQLSCYTTKQPMREKLVLINNGMTKSQVTEILGPPKDRQFKGEDEAWQYCQSGMSTFEFTIIWFYNGQVTGMNTYKTYTCPTFKCEKCFREVNWNEAPDRIIEIRSKNE